MTYLIAGIFFAAITGAACWKSYEFGQNSIIVDNAKTEKLIQDVRRESALGAADAIAKIDIKQVTIQGRLQKEIQTNTVYRDCVNSPVGLRAINDALTNVDSGPVGGGKLPAPAAIN